MTSLHELVHPHPTVKGLRGHKGPNVMRVNNGSPVTIMVEGRLFRSWYRYMKKSEICFTDGVEKPNEFSLHHFLAYWPTAVS